MTENRRSFLGLVASGIAGGLALPKVALASAGGGEVESNEDLPFVSYQTTYSSGVADNTVPSGLPTADYAALNTALSQTQPNGYSVVMASGQPAIGSDDLEDALASVNKYAVANAPGSYSEPVPQFWTAFFVVVVVLIVVGVIFYVLYKLASLLK